MDTCKKDDSDSSMSFLMESKTDDEFESCSDSGLFSMTDLLRDMYDMDEEILLNKHGYIKNRFISDLPQGIEFTATNSKNNQLVLIQKISKLLHSTKESIDEDGFTFIVDNDIVKAANILRFLTNNDDEEESDFLIKFIDFFESDIDYYLVLEHVENSVTLIEFARIAYDYIGQKKLIKKEYQQTIKKLMWQLIILINWLHTKKNCCHLNIFPENIKLKNANFIQNKNGLFTICADIQIKLTGFGVSNIYGNNNDYKQCDTRYISLQNELYISPNVNTQNYYNSRAADLWCYGVVLYFCFTGDYPKISDNICESYIKMKHLNDKNISSLLNGLFILDENKRFSALNVIKHKLFQSINIQ
eukprot:142325_1